MQSLIPPLSCVAAVVILAAVVDSRADIIIDGYTDAEHDRFTNSGSFILDGFDLSGVGQAANGRWATAISRNVIISANHFAPSGTISFYTDNDPSGTAVTRDIKLGSGLQVPNTDLYLAVLDSELPGSITHYDFATTPVIGPSGKLAIVDPQFSAFLFGRSPKANPNTQDQAVGRNLANLYGEDFDFQGNSDNDVFLFSDEGPSGIDSEAKYDTDDSGAPAFVNNGGNLLLLGTAAFTYTLKDDMMNVTEEGSGVNYTGNQATFINNYITTNAVPEPSALLLGALAGLPIWSRRRRRSRPIVR